MDQDGKRLSGGQESQTADSRRLGFVTFGPIKSIPLPNVLAASGVNIRAIFFRLPTIRKIHFVQIGTGCLVFSLPLSLVFNQPRLSDWISLQNICDNCLFHGLPCCNTLNASHETRIFDFRSLSVPPNWQRHTTKASEKFHPLSLYYFRRIFGERSYPPRNSEPQTSKVSFPRLVLADSARELKIQNDRHKT